MQLPEGSAAATRMRLQQRFVGAVEARPSGEVSAAIDSVQRLLRGERNDLSNIRLDLESQTPFRRRVYEAARRIAPGTTVSYGELAARLGQPGASRAVGQALGRNPFAIVVPCHRILAAGGRTGGFTANGGVTTKLRLLELESAVPGTGRPPGKASAENPSHATPDPLRFDFDTGEALAHLRACDRRLARLIDSVGPFGMELKPMPNLFAALAEAIVYQQLTGKAAATIYGRLCALFPRACDGPTPRHILRTPDDRLRGAGLSGSKMLSLRDLARRAEAGEIPAVDDVRRMDNDQIVEQLTRVRGIGRWTVEMLLMFRLGRPDVLPVDDYGIRKGFALAFRRPQLPTPKELAVYGERWAPYRTVASWYLWRALDRRGSS